MFSIRLDDTGDVIVEGRLDAAQSPHAQQFLDQLAGPCRIDMAQLDYISSAGLGVLLRTHKRLMTQNDGLKLVKVSKHINDIFCYSGFDKLFEITVADPPE